MEGPGAAPGAASDTTIQQALAEAIAGFGEMSFPLFVQMLDQARSNLEQAVQGN